MTADQPPSLPAAEQPGESPLPEDVVAPSPAGGRAQADVEDLLAIANLAASRLERPYLDHADLLYDQHGLPT